MISKPCRLLLQASTVAASGALLANAADPPQLGEDPIAAVSFDAGSSAWVAEAGTYTVRVGASSEDIRHTATFVKAREEKIGSASTTIGADGR